MMEWRSTYKRVYPPIFFALMVPILLILLIIFVSALKGKTHGLEDNPSIVNKTEALEYKPEVVEQNYYVPANTNLIPSIEITYIYYNGSIFVETNKHISVTANGDKKMFKEIILKEIFIKGTN